MSKTVTLGASLVPRAFSLASTVFTADHKKMCCTDRNEVSVNFYCLFTSKERKIKTEITASTLTQPFMIKKCVFMTANGKATYK